MDAPTTRHSRSAHPRFFRKQSPLGVAFILLGFVLCSLLWMGCEDAPTYTVTFNTNGGTAVTSQTVKKGDLVKKPADPTRKDHVFGGWYSDEALTQVYDFKAPVNAAITLYAKWTRKPEVTTYTVTFNTNKGTAVASQNVKKDGTVAKPADPIRKDYVFGGWYSDEALTQVYDFKAPVNVAITLYAKWTPIYRVMFNTNGGTAIATQIVAKNATAKKPADPTRKDYVLAGWYSDEALTQVYDFKAPVNAAITLYAKWTPIYRVMFNTNDGTAIATQTVAKNATAKKPADPIRAGYVFAGWYLDEALTQVYDFKAPVNAAITLYAKWTPIYRVMFNTNGGTAIATQTVAKNATAKKPADPTRKDYVFAGWYSDEALTQVYDFRAPVNAAITLYAKWTRKPGVTTYTVMFNTNGGTAIADQSVKKGGTVPKPADPTRKDYVFAGWYSDEALTQVYNFASTVTGAITLYAKWTRKPGVTTYTVTFDSQGGTAIPSQTVLKDGTATKPTNPTKADATFVNWYSDKALTQVYDFASKVTKAITLYAKWTVATYKVTFDSKGGTAVSSQTVKKGGMVAKPADPIRAGYVFAGWYSDEALTQVYNFAAKVTKAITLYAKWTVAAYKVTFDTKGGTAVSSQTVRKGGMVAKPVDPIRAGYVFAGWYSDEALTQVYDFTSTVTADITLHVKWRPFPTSFTIAAAGGATQVAIETTLQFRITNVMPSGADTAVKWLVEGGAANGTIDAAGLYAAPNTIPTPAQITIRATGVRDATVTQTYSLTVVDNPKFKTIPDANFRKKLKAIVPNAFVGDRLDITHRDVTGRVRLSVQNASIANMEGIQYFTALRRLNCDDNQLTALDVSQNTALTELDCNDNQLTALDVSKNPALRRLDCNGNQLTALDVSQNPALTDLNCGSNQLTALDVSQNTALTDLNCGSNQLTALDVSQHLNLASLLCSNNRLTVLDVSQNTALATCSCDNNNLTSLDLSQNTALRVFSCSNNSLTSLDMRGMREASILSISFWILNAGVNGKNLLTTLKVHDNLKKESEIKEAKTNRGTNITIEVYTAAAGSTTYTQSCANYDPNANNRNGKCLSTN